jgi:hypothetical protein
MTVEHLRQVALLYAEHLCRLGVMCRENGLPLQHVRWMCSRIADLAVAPDLDKTNRWLGFVQGVLFSEKVFTIKEMRDHNRTEKT